MRRLLRVDPVAVGIGRFRLHRVALDEFVVVGLVLIDRLVQIHPWMDEARRSLHSLGAADHSAVALGSRMGRGSVRISVFGPVLCRQNGRHFSRLLMDRQRSGSSDRRVDVDADVIDTFGHRPVLVPIGRAVIPGSCAGQSGGVQVRHAPLAQSGS